MALYLSTCYGLASQECLLLLGLFFRKCDVCLPLSLAVFRIVFGLWICGQKKRKKRKTVKAVLPISIWEGGKSSASNRSPEQDGERGDTLRAGAFPMVGIRPWIKGTLGIIRLERRKTNPGSEFDLLNRRERNHNQVHNLGDIW